MSKFTQFQLDNADEQKSQGQESPNVLRVDKDLNVKNQFIVNNIEAHNRLGSKINGKSVDASYRIQLTDFLISVTNVATARTITLPSPTVAGPFKIFIVKDASGSAATTNITISPNGSEVIDGDTTKVITSNFGIVGLYTDSVNWFTA